ncbi:MAG: prepilin-type N-terminal cleavage/methylation domain-containing protein [Gemmatimonadetes bacterium]|nr:prepilin-type N-terminal cleavage/methylation domain-containing protein [Gemmatimonadota bacterium]
MTGRNGFTLVELLIVVVIIGILAAVAVAKYRQVQRQTYRVTMEADLKVLATKQELHHQINLTYGTIADLEDFLASDGVTVVLNWLDVSGFAATATHAALEDFVCGYYVGDAPAGTTGPATAEGRTECG